jgi:O-antigen/teichoic acid export membrane protein
VVFGVSIFWLARGPGGWRIGWSGRQFRQMIGYGGKAMVLGAIQLAIDPIIRLIADGYGGVAIIPALELAMRLIAVARSFVAPLAQVLIPAFARRNASCHTCHHGGVRANDYLRAAN